MDESFTCKYCNKVFINKGNLTRHTNKNKKCLKERNNVVFKCESSVCKYTANSHVLITNHQYGCEHYIKYKEEQVNSQKILIESANEKISMLNDLLNKELSKTKIVNNIKNVNNNDNRQIQSNRLTIDMRNNIFGKILNPAGELFDKITEYLETNMTADHIIDPKKFQMLLVDMITSDNYYACLDQIGCNFVNKEADGMIKTDVYAQNLLEFISEPIKSVAKDIASREIRKLSQEAAEADDEKTEENKRKRITLIKSQFSQLQNIKDDSKGLRKLLAQKTFYPRSKIQEMIHEEKSTSDQKLFESSSSRDKSDIIIPLSEMICDEIVSSIFAENTEEELEEIYSCINDFMTFIIMKFLICEKTLIYRYDTENDMFFYYTTSASGGINYTTSSGGKNENRQLTEIPYEKMTEKYCDSIYKYFYEKTKQLQEIELSVSFSDKVIRMMDNVEVFSIHMKKHLVKFQEVFK